MKKMIRTVAAMAAFAAGSVSLLAQPAVKLIVVDMAKVFDSHYKSEDANAKFREAEQKAQETAEELNKQGQMLMEEYRELLEQSKNTLLTQEARTKAEGDVQRKAEEIRRKQQDVEQFRVNTQRSLQQRIKTHRDLLLEEISKSVSDIAKKQGATLVLDKSGPTLFGIPAVIYSDPAFDITEQVITEVNKDRPAPVAPAAGSAPAPKAPAPSATGASNAPNVTPATGATPETKK